MGYIDKITSPSGKIYIGQAKDLRKRINAHRNSMKRKWTNVILINSFKKHGFDEHYFQIIEECDNDNLNDREVFWIKEFNSFYGNNSNGMNMTIGGDGHTGFNTNDENRRKILLDNLYSKGHNPFLGKTHTEENKKKMAELMSKRNKERGIKIPMWGAEKGWSKVRKKVVAYGNDGDMIDIIFNSLTEAAKHFGLDRRNVTDSLAFDSWNFGKWKFKYYSEDLPKSIPIDDIRLKDDKKPVIVLDKKMYFVGEYDKPEDASKHLNIPVTTIRRAAAYNNLRPIRKGYIFAYKEDYHYSLTSEMEVGRKPLILKPKKQKQWQDQKAELH